LGEDGNQGTIDGAPENDGGVAGVAINKNGNTLIITNGATNIKGAII